LRNPLATTAGHFGTLSLPENSKVKCQKSIVNKEKINVRNENNLQ
jgi:hypothetical protein